MIETDTGKPPHAHTKLDRVGIWISAACAVHCMVMPVVLVIFPLLAWARWTRKADLTVFIGAACIGLFTCLLSLRHHREWAPLSLVVAGIVIYVSVQLGIRTVHGLLDTAPKGMAERIKTTVEGLPGVIDCHNIRVRYSGSHVFVDAHILVDPNLTIVQAHDLT